jgi:hypothetical protein
MRLKGGDYQGKASLGDLLMQSFIHHGGSVEK